MEIAFITPEFVTEPASFDGGLANYIYKVAKQLVAEGHRVHVCVIAEKNEVFEYEGLKVHRINIRNKFVSALDVLTLRKFSILLRWSYWSFVLNQYAKRALSKETVLHYTSYTCPSLWQCLAPQKTKVIRLSGYQPDIYLELHQQRKTWEYRQIRFLENLVVQQDLKKFAPSQLLINRLSSIAKGSIKLIRTPFEVATDFDGQNLEGAFDISQKYFLFFGSVSALKGCFEISQVLPQILNTYPDMHFVCIGKDSSYQGNSFKSIFLSQAGDHKNRVHIFDKMPKAKLYQFIKNAHRVVLPSRLDNLPNTLLESLGFDRIVIASKKSSLDEVIIDGVNGFLCENSDAPSLFDAFKRSMELSEVQTKNMVSKIRETMQSFTLPTHVRELTLFYQSATRNN